MDTYSVARQVVLMVVAALTFNITMLNVTAQDIAAELARAQSLYYGAEFKASIDALQDLEKRVGNDAQRVNERLDIQLYLGLAYLGLNETEQAKARFVRVCTLDEKYVPSPMEFSPKVISLFSEAKADCAQNYCGRTCGQVEALISSGDLDAAQNAWDSGARQCACSAGAKSALTNARFKKGQEFYDGGRFADAAKEFDAVLALDDAHSLAREYSKLSQQRAELGIQQAFSDWRFSFDNKQYDKAAAVYEKIKSSDSPALKKLITEIETEYQKVLDSVVISWKAACATADAAKMDAIRREASAIASRLPVGINALAQMAKCTQKGCISSEAALAINRLRNRVNPLIEPSLQRFITRGIRVAIQIDVNGNVQVRRIDNANERVAAVLTAAVEQWRFYPAVVDNEPRCVETELPITIIQP